MPSTQQPIDPTLPDSLHNEVRDTISSINDLLFTGDALFVTQNDSSSNISIANEMQKRNNELIAKENTLREELIKKDQIINTRNRDFSDHIDTTDEKRILSIEDYTMFVFALAYIFAICVFIYTYTFTRINDNKLYAFLKALGIAFGVTLMGGLIFYAVA